MKSQIVIERVPKYREFIEGNERVSEWLKRRPVNTQYVYSCISGPDLGFSFFWNKEDMQDLVTLSPTCDSTLGLHTALDSFSKASGFYSV